jgi:hypothetical protein
MERSREIEGQHTATATSDGVLLSQDSEQQPTLSIVMPTLNEEQGIETCIRKAKRALHDLGISGEVIVSDSSTDRTPQIAREMGAIVVEPDKTGYGYAYRYGFESARGEYIAMGDADATYDFEELPKLLDLIEDGADIAIGNRLGGELKPGSMPKLHQYIGNPLLTWFLNVFYDAGVSDAHSGMRVLTRDALDQLRLESDGMEFASEMIMSASVAGLDIREVPITYHERIGEATLDSFHDGWRHVRFMLTNAPGYLFSGSGFALILVGMTILGLTFTNALSAWVELGARTVIVGCLFTLVGVQVVYLGVFATIAGDPIQDTASVWNGWVRQHLKLEHGILIGTIIFLLGTGYAVASLYQWVQSGFTSLPFLISDIVAFTAIVLGVQTIFQSFFLSLIGSQSSR